MDGGKNNDVNVPDCMDGCNPPLVPAARLEDMLKRRRDASKTESMIITTVSLNSALSKCFTVKNQNGRKTYDVVICNTPSCTCPDFKKNGSKVHCKHILFVLITALGQEETNQTINERYIGDDDPVSYTHLTLPTIYSV